MSVDFDLELDRLEEDDDGTNKWIRVDRAQWQRAGHVAKEAGFRYFCFLSGMDWQPNPNLDGERTYDLSRGLQETPEIVVDQRIRRAGGSSRFQVIARLYDVERHRGLHLSADLDGATPAVDSWTSIFKGADWHEREIAEMFGFDFVGHPGLRKMYLPAEFEGFPMRKDFPLLARVVRPWPGLVDMEEMPQSPTDPASSDDGSGSPATTDGSEVE